MFKQWMLILYGNHNLINANFKAAHNLGHMCSNYKNDHHKSKLFGKLFIKESHLTGVGIPKCQLSKYRFHKFEDVLLIVWWSFFSLSLKQTSINIIHTLCGCSAYQPLTVSSISISEIVWVLILCPNHYEVRIGSFIGCPIEVFFYSTYFHSITIRYLLPHNECSSTSNINIMQNPQM